METKKILIIEDNKLNLKLIRTILLISNFKVIEAENAEMGFQLLEEQRPDIILMDIQLPGMDGLTATRRIKASEAYKDIPVIALTAKAMDGDEQKAMAAGCDGYIVKPINTQGFISTLNDCIKDAPPPSSLKNGLIPKDPKIMDTLERRIKVIDDAFTQRRKILIVDDEHLNVQVLEHQLTEYSYDTIGAYCGEDALEIVKKELPDLIILDIMMPGIDGFEVTRIIRADEKTSKIPIILVTALNSKEDRIRGLNLGADEFLNKPIMFEELHARVRSLLRLKAYQEQINGYNSIRQAFIDPNTENRQTESTQKSALILMILPDQSSDLLDEWAKQAPFEILRVNNVRDAISTIDKKHITVVLLDNVMSNQDLLYLCQRIRDLSHLKNTQVILLTEFDRINDYIDQNIHCPDDFVIKPFKNEELNARVKNMAEKKKRLDKMSHRFEHALHAAMTDPLTNMYNKNYFFHFLDKEIRRVKRHKTPLSLMMIDIDNFKAINDTYGHLIGDIILKDTAQLIINSIREVDIAARYGGEEFTVILPYTDEVGSAIVGERIRNMIESHAFDFPGSETSYHITVSIGVVSCQNKTLDKKALLQVADELMYLSKKQGKNKISFRDLDIDPVSEKQPTQNS